MTLEGECASSRALRVLVLNGIAYLCVREVAQLQALQRAAEVTDLQWKHVAHAYVCVPTFWHVAAKRPRHTARPLQTWKEELKRLIEYKHRCRDLGEIIDDAYIMSTWKHIDRIVSKPRSKPL